MNIECDKLIYLVQQRRVLYNLTRTAYSDKNVKSKLWEEVYVEIIDN